jgi:hypothetical protein
LSVSHRFGPERVKDYVENKNNAGKFIIYQEESAAQNQEYKVLQIIRNPTSTSNIVKQINTSVYIDNNGQILGGRSRQRKTLARKNRKSRSRKNRKSRSRKNRK